MQNFTIFIPDALICKEYLIFCRFRNYKVFSILHKSHPVAYNFKVINFNFYIILRFKIEGDYFADKNSSQSKNRR